MSEDIEFDPYAACEAMREEMEWQAEEWKREREEEMLG